MALLNKNMFLKPKLVLEGLPFIKGNSAPKATPDQLVKTCPACKHTHFVTTLEETLYVCPDCAHHIRIDARKRIELIADPGTFSEIDAEYGSFDRIGFREYDEKLAKAREESGEPEGVVTGVCEIGGNRTALFAMNSLFMMGSMGTVLGDKVTRLFEYATKERLPMVGFTVSGGARVQEGILSLMQMAKTSGAVLRHSNAGLFYLTMLTDPTTGGVTASFAMEGDIILSEPGALIGFAGPRVIEQTMRQKLPKGFQRAEFLLEKGFVDNIVDRRKQKDTIAMLLNIHTMGGWQHAGI